MSRYLQSLPFLLMLLVTSLYTTITATPTTPMPSIADTTALQNDNYQVIDFVVEDVGSIGILLEEHLDLSSMCLLLNISAEKCNCKNLPELCSINGTTANIVDIQIECTIDDAMKAQVTFTLIASFVGIIGNLAVLIIRSHSLHKSLHHQLIMGLALADLLFSIAQFIYNVPYLIFGCKWVYGNAMCHILPSFLGISSSIDVGFITIIAVERYIAIVYPLKKKISRQRIYALVVVNLLVGVCSIIPMFLVFEVSTYGTCIENWSDYPNGSLIYSWLLMIFLVMIPVTITTILYCRSMKVIKAMRSSEGKLLCLINNNNDHNNFENSNKSEKHLKRNRKLLLVIFSLLVAFILLHSPNRIAWLIIDHMGHKNISLDLFKGLKIFGLVPYSLHIMINPIIYSVIDKTFRKNAMRLFSWHKSRLETSSSSQTIHFVLEATNENTNV